jgi:hypothetical protein
MTTTNDPPAAIKQRRNRKRQAQNHATWMFASFGSRVVIEMNTRAALKRASSAR